MEYANSGSLSDVMSGKRKINTEQFKELIQGILDGLAYLHSRSPAIIHRDLKPSNILLHEENGQLIPKICDFGISKELQGTISQTATAALGTIDYMSPEQIEGKAPSPATDLWALGCMIYEYFNGQPPFGKASQGASAQQVYWKVMNGKLDEGGMKKVSEPFRAFVKGCLVVDVSKRIRCAGMAREILLGQKKPGGGGITMPPAIGKVALGSIAILLLGALLWMFWPSDTGTAEQGVIVQEQNEPEIEGVAMEATPQVVQERPSVINPTSENELETGEQQRIKAEKERIAAEKTALEAEKKELERQKQRQQVSSLPTAIQKLVNDMVGIPGGTFWMGCSPADDECYDDEKPRHQVTLSSFSLGKYEVTQAQWRAVTNNNPSHFSGCDNCPVENVSWNDVQEFIRKLNQMTGENFRLPTEAEWEFAASGGTKSQGDKYSGSNSIGSVAWNGANSGGKTQPVGKKSPNELGLYDMSGNVFEWCSDWHGDYSSGSKTNPKGPTSGSHRVIRGGSWLSFQACRVSYRGYQPASYRHFNIGFRLALSQ